MWTELKADSDYEIFTEYPHVIRKKGSDKIVNESVFPNGYIKLGINGKTKLKHRLIAQQFLNDYDENLVCDHISRNTFDNRIENLRMITQTEN